MTNGIQDIKNKLNRKIRTFSENDSLVLERREHIRKNATALFVKKPYYQTSTHEILKACGISRGSLYYYVGSKEDILTLIQEHTARGYISVYTTLLEKTEQMKASIALQEAIRVFCKWADDYQDALIVSLHEVANAPKEQREPRLNSERRNMNLIEAIIRRGIESGEFSTRDPKMVAHITYLGIRAWADKRWYLRKSYTLEQYTKILTESVMGLLKTGL